MKSASGLVIAATLAIGASASANPAWCPTPDKLGRLGDVTTITDAKRLNAPLGSVVGAVVHISCAAPNDLVGEPRARDIAQQAYAKINDRLQMTDADWQDVAVWALASPADQGQLNLSPKDSKALWSTLDPIEQYATMLRPMMYGVHSNAAPDAAYVADAFGSSISQLGRVAYASVCLASTKPVEWAMCQGDLDALDAKQVAAELHADKAHDGYARMTIRLTFDKVITQAAQRAEDVKKLVAKDATYGKLFEIASAQRHDWDTRWKANGPALAVAQQLDDSMSSGSSKAAEGCHDKTWSALASTIGGVPAASFATRRVKDKSYEFVDDVVATVVGAILTNADSYLAVSAYVACRDLKDAKDNDSLVKAFEIPLARFPGMRGPRTSTQSEILTAKLKLDDRTAKLDFPDYQRLWDARGTGDTSARADGTVLSVKPDDAKHSTITFDQKLDKEVVDTGCTQSNHIHSIRADGSLEYEVNCTGTKTVTVDVRPKPAKVLLRYTSGLSAGMPVAVYGNAVFAAWQSAKSKSPSRVLGVDVK